MSKSIKGVPLFRIGIILTTPPGMTMPPLDGFTPFWEKELGLLYAANKDARKVDLLVGCSIRFEIQKVAAPRNTTVTIARSISNV